MTGCTVYQVPDEGDTDATGVTGAATMMTSTGTSTGTTDQPDPTTTSTSSPTTGPDPSGDPSSATDPATSDPTTEDPPAQCDFPTTIQPIFSASCGCHLGGMPPKGLALAEGQSFASLVGVDSLGQPGTPRVAPGDPAGSWLVTKLKPMPPVGLQMPEGGMLAPDQITLIESWISDGAPEAGAFDCGGGGNNGEPGTVTIDEQGPVNVEIGEMLDLDVTVLDEQGEPVMGATVKWLSSDESALFVDAKGTLLGLVPGSSEVTAEVEGVLSPPLTVTVLNNQAVAAASFADALNVLTTNCGCHKGAMPAALAFDLAPADVHAALLAPATQDAQTKRVIPDAPGQSYLFKKLTRTMQVTGEQMPKGKAPLEAEKVQLLFRWIFNGAPQ
jgi:hypothetical protein